MSLININKFRNAEILNEDNKYNKMVQEAERKKLLAYKEEVEIPNNLSPSDKNMIDRYAQGFLNQLDNYNSDFFQRKPEKDLRELISRWNFMVQWFNNNISPQFSQYLYRLISTSETKVKMNTMEQWAKDKEFTDVNEVIRLNEFVQKGIFQRIPHLLFSKETGIIPEKVENKLKKLGRKTLKRKQEEEQQKLIVEEALKQQGVVKPVRKLPAEKVEPVVVKNPVGRPKKPEPVEPVEKKAVGRPKKKKEPAKQQDIAEMFKKQAEKAFPEAEEEQPLFDLEAGFGSGKRHVKNKRKGKGKGERAPYDVGIPTPSGYNTSFLQPNSKSIRVKKAPYSVLNGGKVRPNFGSIMF